MNLVIDFGNTRIKAAIFNDTEQKQLFIYENQEKFLAEINSISAGISSCIISSVSTNLHELIQSLSSISPLPFTNATPIPILNLYQSGSTLGSDRLAAAVGANAIFKNQNVLNIDTGTCIKFNFINKQNEFVGGSISPGLQMRLNALHHFTAKLPQLNVPVSFDILIGKNTEESLLSGALTNAILETDAVIDAYRQEVGELKIILSGGDTDFFAGRLKNSIFARPNLVLEGLNSILIHNVTT